MEQKIKDSQEKSEGKKMEVSSALALLSSYAVRATLLIRAQIIRIQSSMQQGQTAAAA